MPQTVLCIDNDPGLVSIYSMGFADCGYHLLLACDGHYGLYLLDRNVVHVVVLDYEIPEMDGRGVIREIVRRDRNLPIVLTTGPGSIPVDLLREVRLAIAKPVLTAQLLFCIKAVTQSADALNGPTIGMVDFRESETARMTVSPLD